MGLDEIMMEYLVYRNDSSGIHATRTPVLIVEGRTSEVAREEAARILGVRGFDSDMYLEAVPAIRPSGARFLAAGSSVNAVGHYSSETMGILWT